MFYAKKLLTDNFWLCYLGFRWVPQWHRLTRHTRDTMKTPAVRRNIRIPAALVQQIDQLAKKDNRAANNWIVCTLQAAVTERTKQRPAIKD